MFINDVANTEGIQKASSVFLTMNSATQLMTSNNTEGVRSFNISYARLTSLCTSNKEMRKYAINEALHKLQGLLESLRTGLVLQ